jgi:hypothetical protein
VQTIPGFGPASLKVTEGGINQRVGRDVSFGEVSGYADVPAGEVTFQLHRTPADGPAIAETRETLRNRRHYTVVALQEGGESLLVLPEGRAEGGQSRMRVVHAAPELGNVDVRLGDTPVAERIGLGEVSGYETVGPGAYAVSVMRPGAGGAPIASQGAVTLTAGTSSTAFVIGTSGEPVRTIVASDRAAAPRGPVATGLGGLADEDSDLLLAALAGLLGALAGAVIYVALTARARDGGV